MLSILTKGFAKAGTERQRAPNSKVVRTKVLDFMSVIPFGIESATGLINVAGGVDTHLPGRVDSPSDTVSSWTNRRKDLRVMRPAAATAGFFFSAKTVQGPIAVFIDESVARNVSPIWRIKLSLLGKLR